MNDSGSGSITRTPAQKTDPPPYEKAKEVFIEYIEDGLEKYCVEDITFKGKYNIEIALNPENSSEKDMAQGSQLVTWACRVCFPTVNTTVVVIYSYGLAHTIQVVNE